VWGSNEYGILGLEKFNEIFWQPTHNEFFKNYNVNKIACGQLHSIVVASLIKKAKSSTVFTIGRPAS